MIQDKRRSIRCLKCGTPTGVIDSRTGKGNHCRRRRVCLNKSCAYRFTTYESPRKPKYTKGLRNKAKALIEELNGIFKRLELQQ